MMIYEKLLWIIARTLLLLTHEFNKLLLELHLRHLQFIGTSSLFNLKVKLALLKTLLVSFPSFPRLLEFAMLCHSFITRLDH